MADPKRIAVEEAHGLLEEGAVQLVCAYADKEKCDQAKLPWSRPFEEFELEAPTLPKEQKIIFY